ncbi:5'-methylthioadenosine phosphorylase [Rhizorhabdus dicambivorans]|uniref:S-methyl-5'-thioadenosine phosphorylase n=1 Tax=Rhizorhabdus dicambivorans TaxID=1850238 RepID=A0A2A4FR86_9SPHN|nr:5'-methylthioadenosine phosphorylase [Rhizorhabdus dicambivorans]ATE64310.1 5'-methylthioadenosine phosphorylase [Rhizorhabdus dicambivorans]PCE40923.1 5'-methylthioadenosine phosphorylase [Rhizorhabdus dicambivorans]
MANRLGLIGGSGLYRMPALADGQWIEIDTAWGKPSDALLLGTIGDREVAFLPRHGRGHRVAPHEINYRANIAALKAAGCTEVLAISAAGGFHGDVPPGSFVLVDQYIDRTVRGGRSFFGQGIVAHVAFARPVCGRLNAIVAAALAEEGGPHRIGGTMLVIEGPQFSTRAESLLHKSWGCDVVGMTGLPEARLAREAELCYASVAMVTDNDAWSDEEVDVATVIATMGANVVRAQALVSSVATTGGGQGGSCAEGCSHALDAAVITARDAWPIEASHRLATISPRTFSGGK